MPDHLHALLTGEIEQANFLECVRRFKQLTSFHYKRVHKEELWQPGYYERVLRDDEATEAIIRYIMENPIRAGLTSKLGEYPLAGSDVYDLSALLTAWNRQS